MNELKKEYMKHMQADKYTIAWFKIAEFVSRGEKERALGVYRLLSHSFNDDAIARQLEADIYFFCNEQDRAISLYRQAMELYQKSKRIIEATAINEHLVLLLPGDLSLRMNAIHNYKDLKNVSKMYLHCKVLFEAYIRDNKRQEIEGFVFEIDAIADPIIRGLMYQQIILIMHKADNYSALVMSCIEKAVKGFLSGAYEHELQEFLAMMQGFDQDLYLYAVACFEQ